MKCKKKKKIKRQDKNKWSSHTKERSCGLTQVCWILRHAVLLPSFSRNEKFVHISGKRNQLRRRRKKKALYIIKVACTALGLHVYIPGNEKQFGKKKKHWESHADLWFKRAILEEIFKNSKKKIKIKKSEQTWRRN